MHNKQKHINLGSELPHFVTILQFNKTSILSPSPPPTEGMEFPWEWGVSKTKTFKEMYEASLEFPEGWWEGL